MHTKDAIQFALTVSNGAVLSAIDEYERRCNDVSNAERGVPPALGSRAILHWLRA